MVYILCESFIMCIISTSLSNRSVQRPPPSQTKHSFLHIQTPAGHNNKTKSKEKIPRKHFFLLFPTQHLYNIFPFPLCQLPFSPFKKIFPYPIPDFPFPQCHYRIPRAENSNKHVSIAQPSRFLLFHNSCHW